MIEFLILVGCSEYNIAFLAHSYYSLDDSENVNVDALSFKLLELVFRLPKWGKGKIIFAK